MRDADLRISPARQCLLVVNTMFEFGVALASMLFMNQFMLASNAIGLGLLSLLLVNSNNRRQLRPALIVLAVFHSSATLALIANNFHSAPTLNQLAQALKLSLSATTLAHAGFAAAFTVAAMSLHLNKQYRQRLQKQHSVGR